MTEPRHRLGKRPPIWALPRDRTLSNLRFLTLAALPPSLLRQRVNSLIMTRWLRGPLCRRVVFALAALFQLSCRFIEKHLSYRTNANAGADSRIWRAAAKLISDGQHPSSNGVPAPLRCRQSPDASKPDGCDRQRGHVVGFAGRSASGRFQLRCFGIPSRRQISSACRRKLGSERACQLRSPKEVARNLGVSIPTLYRWLPASERS